MRNARQRPWGASLTDAEIAESRLSPKRIRRECTPASSGCTKGGGSAIRSQAQYLSEIYGSLESIRTPFAIDQISGDVPSTQECANADGTGLCLTPMP